MHVAFATCKKEADLTSDDKLLAGYLKEKKINVTPVIWDDKNINWSSYDVVILRSIWDYFSKPDQFNAWLDQLEWSRCFVLNPVSVIRWNHHKKYFLQLSIRGIPLPPYQYCLQKTNWRLTEILKDNGWEKAVVKPAISCGSFNTWVTSLSSAPDDESRLMEMLQTGDVIVQKFMNEIITDGELSLIFFNKIFSHAICKKANKGDFRVQTKFGGTAVPVIPDKRIVQQSAELLNSIPEPLLYARVDGIIAKEDNSFYLMELELTEPALSVKTNEKACENFYHALQQLINNE